MLTILLVAGCGPSPDEAPPQVPPPPPAFVPEGADETSAATFPPSFSTIPPASASAATSPAPSPSASSSASPLPPLSSSANAAGPLPPLPSQAPPPASTIVVEQTPPETQWVHAYASGQWVYVSGYGWVWIPADGDVVDDDGVPYVYLYTPRYGWTWYVSPWGYGPYHYGIWVRHPWHPSGWRGHWVAAPHVIVHLGGHPHFHPRPYVPHPHGGGHRH